MRKRIGVVGAISAVLLLSVSACSSSGSSSTNSTTGGSTASGSSTAAASNIDCSKLNTPTTVKWQGPTEPVKPPTGQKFVVISTTSLALEAAARPVRGIQDAVAKLGWKSLVLDGKATPAVYNQNILQAINLKADAIIVDGFDPALVANSLAKARAKGIIVMSVSETGDGHINPTAPPTGFYGDVSPSSDEMGTLLGESIVCSTAHKANLLAFNDLEYASTKAFVDAAVAVVKACSTCKVSSEQNTTGAQVVTDLPNQTVTYLRTHPDVNAVLAPYDPAAAFQVPAIKAANLGSQLKLFGTYGDLQNLDFIRNGEVQYADIGVPQEWSGWAAVDEVLRVMANQPMVDANLPLVLITKDLNMPAKGQAFTGDQANYQQEYQKLWGLQ